MTINGKIIPHGLSFEAALVRGYAGRIECRAYLDWIKTLPCDNCNAAAPSDPSHINTHKGPGTKSPDFWAIPACRTCHEAYERMANRKQIELANAAHMHRATVYLLQAIFEGRLVWKKI